MRKRVQPKDARRSVRLQLAIPVFVRSKDGDGQDCLEFATALNISAVGALVAVRRSLPKAATISLEIPSIPIAPASGLPSSSRVLRAKAVWIAHLDDYHLLGLKFSRPLSTNSDTLPRDLRKAVAVV